MTIVMRMTKPRHHLKRYVNEIYVYLLSPETFEYNHMNAWNLPFLSDQVCVLRFNWYHSTYNRWWWLWWWYSERNEDSFQHSADRRKETIEINTSHMALKQCVRAMGKEEANVTTSGYVPFRASTLTRLLKNSLWAKTAKAAVIATISPMATGGTWWSIGLVWSILLSCETPPNFILPERHWI